jgi:PIN domain nuclease of toxin-antitoxin system
MSETHVLDACALIAFFNDEPGAEIVQDTLSSDAISLVAAINVYEVVYDALRTTGKIASAERALDLTSRLSCTIQWQLDPKLMLEAAYFKKTYKVSLADSIALGLAKLQQASLVTSDHHEFDPIDAAGDAQFLWIR